VQSMLHLHVAVLCCGNIRLLKQLSKRGCEQALQCCVLLSAAPGFKLGKRLARFALPLAVHGTAVPYGNGCAVRSAGPLDIIMEPTRCLLAVWLCFTLQ
jgi:hypothetical protein